MLHFFRLHTAKVPGHEIGIPTWWTQNYAFPYGMAIGPILICKVGDRPSLRDTMCIGAQSPFRDPGSCVLGVSMQVLGG